MTSGVKRCTPPVDRDVIDLDATLGEQFFDVAVGKAVAEVPAHGQQDHVQREPVAGKRSRGRSTTTNHLGTLRLAPDPSTQRCLGPGARRLTCRPRPVIERRRSALVRCLLYAGRPDGTLLSNIQR
jgi:hypothetical protein